MVQLVGYVISFENERSQIATTSPDLNLHLTDEKQQVVRYVGGYIVFSLIKKYKMLNEKKSSMVHSAVLELLNSLKVVHGKTIKGKIISRFFK